MRISTYTHYIIMMTVLLFLQKDGFSQVPYVPTPEFVVEGMLGVAQVNSSDLLYDLGCGDGRIVIMAARKYGARGVGIDNNPERIKDSWANAKKNGLSAPKVDFREQDLFDTDLKDASVVTLYLLTEVNYRLRPKLFTELKPGTRVVSNSFSMENWEPDSLLNVKGRNVYFWKIPANTSGSWDISAAGNNNEKYVLVLDQVFQKVDGVLHIGDEKYFLVNPKLDVDRLEFSVKNDKDKKSKEMKFSMQIIGDQMKGTISGSDSSPVNFTAARRSGTMKPLDPQLTEAGR